MIPREEAVFFYYYLGVATSGWSGIERGIADILAASVEPEDQAVVARGFASIENFRSKVIFAQTVFEEGIHADNSDGFARLLERASALAKKRNRLAHGHVFHHFSAKVGRRVLLQDWPKRAGRHTSYGELRTLLRPPHGSLGVREVAQIAYEFGDLYFRLWKFQNKLSAAPVPEPAFPELQKTPPTFRHLRAQIHEELGLRPQHAPKKF